MQQLGPCAEKRKKIREEKFGKYKRSKIEPRRLMVQGAMLHQCEDNKNNSKWERTMGCALPIHGIIDKKIKRQTNLDRHGPRPVANVCLLPGPLFFLITDYQN
jgi:hypothetical protein